MSLSNRKKPVLRQKQLRFETLENRELLSVSPLSAPSEIESPTVLAADFGTNAASDYNAHDFQKLFDAGLIDENGDTLVGSIVWNNDAEKRVTSIDVADQNLSGTLDLSGCSELVYLDCGYNELTSLDLTGNTALYSLYISGNYLSFTTVTLPAGFLDHSTILQYDYKIGTNGTIPTTDFDGLLSLYNAGGGTTQYSWFIYPPGTDPDTTDEGVAIGGTMVTEVDGVFTFSDSLNGRVVYCVVTNDAFPDWQLIMENVTLASSTTESYNAHDFQKLFDAGLIDADGNTLKGTITWSDDVEKRVTEIDVSYQELTSTLDLSDCTALLDVNCQVNELTALDVSGCTALTSLQLWKNNLTSLDVSGLTMLDILYCGDNQLTSLDVSGCTALVTLICSGNQLTTLDISTNTSLTSVECHTNLLTFDSLTMPPQTIHNFHGDQYVLVDRLSDDGVSYEIPRIGFDKLASYDSADTTYTWYVWDPQRAENVEIESDLITNVNGVFTFDDSLAGRQVYCVIKHYISPLTIVTDQVSLSIDEISYNTNDLAKVTDSGLADYAVWELIGDEYRLTGINAHGVEISGDIDLSDCTKLQSVYLAQNSLTSLNLSGCTALETVSCFENQLSALDLTGCAALKQLHCNDNNLGTLDVSDCVALKTLNCASNDIASLDLQSNTQLEYLYCGYNSLTQIDLSANTALTLLDCSYNDLGGTLDLSALDNLDNLECSNNLLTDIQLSASAQLIQFSAGANQLTSLDLSGQESLQTLYVCENQLTDLNISGCTALNLLFVCDNNLTTLDVTDSEYLYMLLCCNNDLTSLDVSGFTQLDTLDVSGCTALETLFCTDSNLTSLNVSGCTALVTLGCTGNQLTSLDVSGLTSLEGLYCGGNQLTSLDLTGCVALTELDFADNQMTSLDLSGFTSLERLNCNTNMLVSLDLSGCTSLWDVRCDQNQLVSLDLTDCTGLRFLGCYENSLTSLDLSACRDLEVLECYENELKTLDVSGCANLTMLDCYENALTSLNVSGCTALEELWAGYNQLTALNVNSCTALVALDFQYNNLTALNLTGLTALDGLYCSGNRFTFATLPAFTGSEYYYDDQQPINLDWQIDRVGFSGLASQFNAGGGTTTYTWYDSDFNVVTDYTENDGVFTFGASLNGQSIGCEISNDAFPDLWLYTEFAMVNDGSVPVNSYEKQLVDLQGLSSYSEWEMIDGQMRLVGIDAFGAGIRGDIDLSGCTELKSVNLAQNSLTSLDLSGCSALETVSCSENQLSEINLTGCIALTILTCSDNYLETLDVSDCVALKELTCTSNFIESLNLRSNTELEYLYCGYNSLTQLDLSANTLLSALECSYNNLAGTLNLSALGELGNLECSNNLLTGIQLSSSGKLYQLSCGANQLKSLDLSAQTGLITLYACENQLTSLDVSVCDSLLLFYVCDNKLASLDVSGLTNLQGLQCQNNQLTSLDITGCTALDQLVCYGNKLTFSTLPVPGTITTYWYTDGDNGETQAAVALNAAAWDVDLSAEYLNGVTTYTWYYEDGSTVAANLISGSGGLFQFEAALEGSRIYCEMTNSIYSDLVLRTTALIVADTFGSAPSSFRTTAVGRENVSLAWGIVDGVTGYVVERYNALTGNYDEVYFGEAANCVDTGLTAGTDYTYRVRAVYDGALSPEAELEVSTLTPEERDTLMVTEVEVERDAEETPTKVTLEWSPIEDAAMVVVFRNGVPVDSEDLLFTSYEDDHPGTMNTYVVYTYVSPSDDSPGYWLYTIPTIITNRVLPEITSHAFTSDGGVQLTRNDSGTNYVLFRDGRPVNIDLEKTTFIDNTAEPGKEYKYILYAADENGRWSFSAIYVVTTPKASNLLMEAVWSDDALTDLGELALV